MECAERFANSTTSWNLNLSQMVEMLSLPSAEETEKFIEQKAAPEVKAAVKSGDKVCKSAAKNLIKL